MFASCEKTKWSYSKENFRRVEVNYVDTYMLGKAKSFVKPTLELSEIIMRQTWKTSNVDNFRVDISESKLVHFGSRLYQ